MLTREGGAGEIGQSPIGFRCQAIKETLKNDGKGDVCSRRETISISGWNLACETILRVKGKKG